MTRIPIILGKPGTFRADYFTRIMASRPFAYFFATEVLIIGAWAESADLNGAFQKSGSFLVLVALFVLWRWVIVSDRRTKIADLERDLSQLTYSVSVLEGNVERAVTSANHRIVGKTADQYFEHYKNATKSLMALTRIERGLAKVQVEIAIIGTAVSAFGDWIIG